MKLRLVLITSILLTGKYVSSAYYKWQGVPTSYVSFIRNVNSKVTYENATKIAFSVLKYSKRYKLNPEKMLGIIATESRFNNKVGVSKTKDFGLTQINHKTAKLLKLNKNLLIKGDVDYSIYAMSIVLIGFRDIYQKREGHFYYTRYNSPTKKNRLIYHNKVSNYMKLFKSGFKKHVEKQ